ncbi:MAG: DUF3305 domain-containing protein [Rhodobacteraceae bacterium]|nr:MAG: DUF3305 domain-containing protein [Paracoccaceae bacterium]
MPLGVVVRRTPGVTRWARWAWRAVAVLPGAPQANWRELRREGDAVEFHVGTLPLTLWRAETEAYVENLTSEVPSIYVVMRPQAVPDEPYELLRVTASPYEAQDYCDSGEELVEKVPMSEGLLAWVADYTARHHVDEDFVKRRRDRQRVDMVEDGKGDARIRQDSDVFRAPARRVVQ